MSSIGFQRQQERYQHMYAEPCSPCPYAKSQVLQVYYVVHLLVF